mmetsp:Transcript_24494/g.28357  ORF Transcript_24494/g.28357 Transcript_24494/m.28357 type:complete len:367 (+) Transcript_24494:149-1249(+)
MIVNKRGKRCVLLLLLVHVVASSTFSDHYCDAFMPCLRREGRWVPGADCHSSGCAATALLHAFPSDKMEPTTTASKTALQNEHFASSQTTSSLSQDSRTTIAPPVLARPSTEAKGDDLKLARIEQKQQQQIEQVHQHEEQETHTPVSVWDRFKPVDIQGGSQQTWSFAQHSNMVEVHIRSPYGNPINANVDLWQGPGNTPQKVLLYSEEGRARPFRCFFSTPPGGYSNSINIRNTATLEFPIQAVINGSSSSSDGGMDLATKEKMERIATAAASASSSSPSSERDPDCKPRRRLVVVASCCCCCCCCCSSRLTVLLLVVVAVVHSQLLPLRIATNTKTASKVKGRKSADSFILVSNKIVNINCGWS